MQFKLNQFTGPLDILLSLIDEKKLDITSISLSEVTEQYIRYLDSLEDKKEDELADFLVIAARLLLLKSRLLLPQFMGEEDEGPSLESQLKLYKAFLDASKKVQVLWNTESRAFFRVEPPRKAPGFVPPQNVTLENLHHFMVQLVERLKPIKPLPVTTIDKGLSLKETIQRIRDLLSKKKKMQFSDLLQNTENKTELIIGFLALLELVKQRTVLLRQEGIFSDIVVEKV